jgi:hypothetical protein
MGVWNYVKSFFWEDKKNMPEESHAAYIPVVQSDAEKSKSVFIPCLVHF